MLKHRLVHAQCTPDCARLGVHTWTEACYGKHQGPQCLNPEPHEPHRWLADADAVTMSPCRGRVADRRDNECAHVWVKRAYPDGTQIGGQFCHFCTAPEPADNRHDTDSLRASWTAEVDLVTSQRDRRGEMLTEIEGKLRTVVQERDRLHAELDDLKRVYDTTCRLAGDENNHMRAERQTWQRTANRLNRTIKRVEAVLDESGDSESAATLVDLLRAALDER